MNIYSLNMIKQKYDMTPVTYTASQNLHNEYLTCICTNADGQDTINFVENGVLLQSFMTFLDMNDSTDNDSTVYFSKLSRLTEILHLREIGKDTFESFLQSIDARSYAELATETLDTLKEVIDGRAALCYLYPSFYKILVCLYEYAEENADLEGTADKLSEIAGYLSGEISQLTVRYEAANDYAKQVFYLPYTKDIKAPTYQPALLYHGYCLEHKQSNCLSNLIKSTAADSATDKSWESFLDGNRDFCTDETMESTEIHSLDDFLRIGIKLIIDNGYTLRKCQNCGGYFCVKYTSNQNYCNRSYSSASTCSEYAARKTYKDKLFENPITTEYTKSYNRLYARIRRKKLPFDTPLKDELIKLRDEYMERYEHTHKKDREAVWKEYIQKNKELLDTK